jgi:hypothetical protein
MVPFGSILRGDWSVGGSWWCERADGAAVWKGFTYRSFSDQVAHSV